MPMTMCQSPCYPEIYYRVQPHVLEAMDQMDIQGCMMPESETIKSVCDKICDHMREMHPDKMEAHSYSDAVQTASPDYYDHDRGYGPGYGPGYGFRGDLLNDLVYILFLNELFRRRRRYW